MDWIAFNDKEFVADFSGPTVVRVKAFAGSSAATQEYVVRQGSASNVSQPIDIFLVINNNWIRVTTISDE